jgi:hypothetical protein
MSVDSLITLLDRPEILVPSLLLSVLALIWVARRVRRITKSDRPDRALSRLAMLIGLGWSSEAVWELTGRIPEFPTELRVLVFFVLEVILVLSMIRAERHIRDHGWPGRSGTTAWVVACSMSVVAGAVSHSLAEALLRMAIPVLLTKQWWDGLFTGDVKRPDWITSWRWTPRRMLLWLGAIEPGKNDADTVNRERLIQQMTRLEFQRRHGSKRRRDRRRDRLARMSLSADDAMIAEVQARVERALWFEAKQAGIAATASPAGVPVRLAASRKDRRVLHRRSLRTLRLTHPKPRVTADQPPVADPRATQDIHHAARLIKSADAGLSQSQIARLVGTSPATVGRALRSTKQGSSETPEGKVNGHRPQLEEEIGR